MVYHRVHLLRTNKALLKAFSGVAAHVAYPVLGSSFTEVEGDPGVEANGEVVGHHSLHLQLFLLFF